MHEWSAEVTVDRDLAHRLISEQFEAVELADLRLLAEGWDNTVWLADERWVFRFPRRQLVVAGMEREMAVLPRLAGRLPLRIPEPVFLGRPADGFPWPFFGAPFIPGREIADAGCDDAARQRLARPLAEFLRVLHELDPRASQADSYTWRYILCILDAMASRINVSLDPEYAQKLSRLAERMHVQEGTLAKSLLSTALDGADPDAGHIARLLDSLPGAYERTQEGIEQARRGEGMPLDELA